MVAGISLFAHDYSSGLPAEVRTNLSFSSRASTLRPSTAYVLLTIADLQPGETILDFVCGIGTIPIHAKFMNPMCFSLGAEIDSDAVRQAAENARSTSVEVVQWDSRRIPLRDGCIDVIVADMPFGIRCGSHRSNARLYPMVLRETSRILRCGGRAVFLVMAKKLFLGSIASRRALEIQKSFDTVVGGLPVAIYVVQKCRE